MSSLENSCLISVNVNVNKMLMLMCGCYNSIEF